MRRANSLTLSEATCKRDEKDGNVVTIVNRNMRVVRHECARNEEDVSEKDEKYNDGIIRDKNRRSRDKSI